MKTKTGTFDIFLLLLMASVDTAMARKLFDTNGLNSRIVGGLPANDVPIPYIVSIRAFGYHICGGSILNERTIVTAAHCLAPLSPRLLKVHAGDKTKAVQDGIVVNVAAIHSHPNWTRETMDYDIGLVRLSKPLEFNDRVQPIQLASANAILRDGSYATVAGWGYTSIFGPGSETLRYARIPIVNPATCRRLFGDIVTSRMICVGDLNGGTDACQMDSGGPLVQKEQLIGIVSWGVGCALANRPGVYSRVSVLLPWLNTTLQQFYQETI